LRSSRRDDQAEIAADVLMEDDARPRKKMMMA
jgi:hypothetical protein